MTIPSSLQRKYNRMNSISFTIDSAADAISTGIEIDGSLVYGIVLDTGISATKLSFQGSMDGGTYKKLNYNGSEYTLTVAAGDFVAVPAPLAFAAPNYLKVRLGTSTGATQQAAARTLKLVVGPPTLG